MRTFVIRARKGVIKANQIFSQVGTREHFEIIAHTLANAFYFSKNMRQDVEVYVILESTPDFPRTVKFSANDGLSFPGFHEQAILNVFSETLEKGSRIIKGGQVKIGPGLEMYGFGFDTLIKELHTHQPIFLLDKKGKDIRTIDFPASATFILSDHLPMPKNSIKGLERLGAKKISLGPKILFASQCVVLVHNEWDRFM